MGISISTGSNLYSSNLNLNANSTKNDDDIKDKSKKRNTINNNNTSLKLNSKKNSVLKGLMKQKENLIDNKNKFMENALKEGKDPKSIQEALKDYDKQIEDIDKQISKLQLDDQRKSLSTENNDKTKKDTKSKEISDKASTNGVKTDPSMDNIVALSEGLEKHKNLSHLKNKTKGNIRELKADIEYDEKFRHIDPKELKRLLGKAETGLENVDKELSTNLKAINTKIKENLKDNTSKNTVDKNENTINIETINTNNSETKNTDKLLPKQLQVAENIKHYTNSLDDKTKDNGEKFNATA